MSERRDSSGRLLNPWEVTPGTKPVTNFAFQVVPEVAVGDPEGPAGEDVAEDAPESAKDTETEAVESAGDEVEEAPVSSGKRRLGR